MAGDLEDRISTLLDNPRDAAREVDAVLGDGYARALELDAERLRVERRITALAARAEDAHAAQELRRAWLHHRTLTGELRRIRELLRRLKDDDANRA